jgi:hypothetical protein
MREHIVSEIRKLAALNGGQAPGNRAFVSATGITESKWRGKYLARWGDALIEAGFEPNAWTGKSDANTIIVGLIAAARHYGHFPTNSEIAMLRASDPSIPSPKTIQGNLGGRAELGVTLKNYIGASLPALSASLRRPIADPTLIG